MRMKNEIIKYTPIDPLISKHRENMVNYLKSKIVYDE